MITFKATRMRIPNPFYTLNKKLKMEFSLANSRVFIENLIMKQKTQLLKILI